MHRWFRGLITQLVRYGAQWWGMLLRVVQCRRLELTLTRMREDLEAGRPCPVCGQIHDSWDWQEGRTSGYLNCIGWARIRLDELQPQAYIPIRYQESNEDLRCRWEEEQQLYRTPVWWYAR